MNDREGKYWKKINWALGNCKTIPKVYFVCHENIIRRWERQWWRKTLFWVNSHWKLPKFDKRYKQTYRFEKIKIKKNELQTGYIQETHIRHIIIKLLKTKDKKKIMKAAGEKWYVIYRTKVANYGPWAKSGTLAVLVNKILLECNHNYPFINCL